MALVIPMEPSLPALDGAACARLDADPAFAPLGALRERFAPGAPGTLYFDANSIGPMPADAPRRMQAKMDGGWRVDRRRSWNERDWLAQPRTLGAAIASVSIASGTSDASDVIDNAGADINHTVEAGYQYLIEASIGNASDRFYMATVEYDRP
jgi:kynureninase